MSLLAWYPLIANGNNQGLDGVNLTVNGSVTYTAGKLGNAATFVGTNTYFKRARFTEQKNFSVSAWVKCSATSSYSQYCFTQGRDINNDSWRISFSPDGTIMVFCIGNQNLSYNVTLNTWYHVAMTIDNDANYVFYLNGNVVKSGTVTTLPDYSESGDIMAIGAHYYANGVGYVLNGQVQDFRYFNHALSTKEVKELAKGLTIHYRLNGSGANPNLVPNAQIWNNSYNCTTGLTRSLVNYDGYDIQRFTASQNITNSGVYTSSFSGNRWNGGTYTWSIEIRGNRSFRIPTVGHERFTIIACDISTEWKKFTGTGVYGQTSYNAFVMYFNSTYSMNSGDWFEVRNFKIEEGSTATPWIPNHYDGNYTSLGFGRKVLPYSIVGSPTNGTGYFGSFSLANYLTTTTFGWNSWGDWEIYCKFTTGTDITTNQVITNCVSGNSMDFGVLNSKFFIGLGTGSNWDIANGIQCFTVEASKTYYVKLAFTGSAYTVSHSVTGFDSLTQDWSLTSSTKIATDGSARLVGNNRASGIPFLGYVDMEQFTVKTGGRTAWSGCTNYIYTPEPDCSGFGNNGTVTNRVHPAVGTPKGLASSQFSGNGYIITETGFPRGTMPPFTINCWVNPQGGVNWYDYMTYRVVNYAGNTVDCRMEVYNNGANIGFYGPFPSMQGIATTKGQWYMMTLTHDGAGNLKAYQNGTQVGSVTCSGESQLNWSPTGWFRVGDGAIDFKGADYRVYATCLSVDDIKSLYQTGASITKNGAFMTGQLVEE